MTIKVHNKGMQNQKKGKVFGSRIEIASEQVE